MSRKKIIIVLVIVMSLWSDSICKEMLDLKLGLFSINDVYGKGTYIGFPEISAGIGKIFSRNIYAGLELNYYQLPKNCNLWGNILNTEIHVLKTFLNIGLITEQKNGFIGLYLGYDLGVDLIPMLISLGRPNTLQLVFTKGFKMNSKENKNIIFDLGVQNSPLLKIFFRCGIYK